MSAYRFTFIDLFCGCGGFALGLQQAGFRCVAAIDSNPEAISVFRANFPRVPHVLQKDLTRFTPERLAALLGNTRVDVVVGGPPCQGFSVVRQVDAANHGPRVRRDRRRYYYREFLRYVDFFQAIATLPIGSIVVQIVAKSLLILMSKGDMVNGERLTPEVD